MRTILTLTFLFCAAAADTAAQQTTSGRRSVELVTEQLTRIAVEQGHKALSARATKLKKLHGDSVVASSLAKLLSHDESSVKAAAAFVIGNTSIKPNKALPALTEAIVDDVEVAEMLSAYGVGRIPRIVADVVVANGDDSVYAGWALMSLGANAKGAVPTLIKGLESKDNSIRWNVAGVLGDLQSAAKDAVPALIRIVKSRPVESKQSTTDNEVHGAAAYSLGQIGFNSETVVPLLIEAAKEDEIQIREWAALGLGRFGSNAKQAIPVLIELLRDPRFEVSKVGCGTCGISPNHWGTAALVNIGPDSVPALTTALNGEHLAVRRHAAEALWFFGPKAKSATAMLIKASKDRDDQVRSLAVFALGSVNPDPELAVPALVAALNDSNAEVRKSAGYSLKTFGRDASAAVPKILSSLKDKDASVRRAMVRALPEIADVEVAVRPLATMLRDPDYEVRWYAAIALGNFGAKAELAIPFLVKTLTDQDEFVRTSARRALEKIRSKQKPQ